jgi:anti-sigma regulatory factor (Ser/Thr protein kinase)
MLALSQHHPYELAANAISHSNSRQPGSHFTVRAEIGPGHRLRVEVHDGGGPWTCTPREPDSPDGRGLLLVSALTSAWGRTGSSDTGWIVWFEMDCR